MALHHCSNLKFAASQAGSISLRSKDQQYNLAIGTNQDAEDLA